MGGLQSGAVGQVVEAGRLKGSIGGAVLGRRQFLGRGQVFGMGGVFDRRHLLTGRRQQVMDGGLLPSRWIWSRHTRVTKTAEKGATRTAIVVASSLQTNVLTFTVAIRVLSGALELSDRVVSGNSSIRLMNRSRNMGTVIMIRSMTQQLSAC